MISHSLREIWRRWSGLLKLPLHAIVKKTPYHASKREKRNKTSRKSIQLPGGEAIATWHMEEDHAKKHPPSTDLHLRGSSWPISDWESEGIWYIAHKMNFIFKQKGIKSWIINLHCIDGTLLALIPRGKSNFGFLHGSLIFSCYSYYFRE